MKQLLVLILMILCTASAFSVTTQKINLEYGKSISVAGRTINLSSASYEKLVVNVDGKDYIYPVDEADENDGVKIAVDLIYEKNRYRNLSVDMNVTVYYRCGDGKCESAYGEISSACCLDCNCSAAYTCFKNRCIKSDLLKCFSDSECDDSDSCTLDICGGDSVVRCSSTKITACVNDDGCCPDGCAYPEDDDCEPGIALQNKSGSVAAPVANISGTNITAGLEVLSCRNDSGCDDNNSSTIDKCDDFGKVCYHISSEEYGNRTGNNMLTGAVVSDAEWSSERKERNIFLKFLDWLVGWI